MKTTVPTALYIDERTKTNLTSYVSGKDNSTFVSGEAGYNRMHATCPFPTVPTAISIENRLKLFLTPYSSGSANSTYVSGEVGYSRMPITCPFPGS